MRTSSHMTLLFAAWGLVGPATAETMRLGVNTHFDQGWPIANMDKVEAVRATGMRDTISWGKVEQAPGQYQFTSANSGFVDRGCALHQRVLLTLTPRNKIYDHGETVNSDAGRQAFAAFAVEVLRRYPCVEALEIGNEINGHSLKGQMLASMPGSYVAILRAVRDAMTREGSSALLLSGSSLSVATGFFDDLFGAGLLPLVDGVVVHPYLPVPEQLSLQLDRLKSIMQRHGGVRPIWASEFGFTYPSPDLAPAHALKMITLLSAAGVARADWYALLDEKAYPNMGLYAGEQARPARDTFALAATRLLRDGNARRIDAGDPLTFLYRFGNGASVLWGSGRPIQWQGAPQVLDARGKLIKAPDKLEDDPVIVEANAAYSLGPVSVAADTMLNFGGRDWSWALEPPGQTARPLQWVDWNWAPYLGLRGYPNFRVMGQAVTTARPGRGQAPALLERYTATRAGRYFLSACFEPSQGKPQTVTISVHSQMLYSAEIDVVTRTQPLPVELAAGEAVSFRYTASTPGGPQLLRRRIRILTEMSSEPALCANKGVEGGP